MFRILILLLLVASPALASVETESSGVFRGSLRHIVDVEDTPSFLAAPGDYIAFRLPGVTYDRLDRYAQTEMYIRRYSEGVVTYDLGLSKFNTLEIGDTIDIDVTKDSAPDVRLTYVAERRWRVSPPCDITCFSDEECTGVCESAGTCESRCVETKPPAELCCKALTAQCLACTQNLSVEEYCEINSRVVGCPETIEPAVPENESLPEESEQDDSLPDEPERPGFFMRILMWMAGLF